MVQYHRLPQPQAAAPHAAAAVTPATPATPTFSDQDSSPGSSPPPNTRRDAGAGHYNPLNSFAPTSPPESSSWQSRVAHDAPHDDPGSVDKNSTTVAPNTRSAAPGHRRPRASSSQLSSPPLSLPPLQTATTTQTPSQTTTAQTPLPDDASPRLRSTSVLPESRIVHPKPIALPTSSGSSTPLSPTVHHGHRSSFHQSPDQQSILSSAFVDNVAHLEAAAERLSTSTSSIGDAIRDLDVQLKRSQSTASNASASARHPQLKRHLSNSSSIVATNSAARSGGYSPAGFIMSPTNSLTGRLRSASKNSSGRPDLDTILDDPSLAPAPLNIGHSGSVGSPDAGTTTDGMARAGPGKASVRSVRSVKPLTLADIDESEPTSLGQQALDDAAKPWQPDDDADINQSLHDILNRASTPGFSALDDDEPQQQQPQQGHDENGAPIDRPPSAQSVNTFQQAADAFIDFDGVHWDEERDSALAAAIALGSSPDAVQAAANAEAEAEADEAPTPTAPEFQQNQGQQGQDQLGAAVPMVDDPNYPTPHFTPRGMARPKSYLDPATGRQMLYYPARVPAMLNLPPKLSKHKASEHNARRSKILSTMADDAGAAGAAGAPQERPGRRRHSEMPRGAGAAHDTTRDSWLPDPLAGQRDSFGALSHARWASSVDLGLPPADQGSEHSHQQSQEQQQDGSAAEQEAHQDIRAVEDEPAAGQHLRRPQRLSHQPPPAARAGRPKSQLPPQLRASAFFELPPAPSAIVDEAVRRAPDGSARDALDSILDASATAPVDAFASNGITGSETSARKHRSHMPSSSEVAAAVAGSPPKEEAKKRSSFAWFRRDKDKDKKQQQADDDAESETSERQALTSSLHEGGSQRGENEEDAYDENEDVDDGQPPTTLLAELQQRKAQQAQRTQRPMQASSNMTLLEMDAVAERQKRDRQARRVNLAWEDPDAHRAENPSDDEDVPLALIAARHQNLVGPEGAATAAASGLRPLGLMEQRHMEDNEPLSHRRARLQGREPPSRLSVNNLAVPRHRSMATLSGPLTGLSADRSRSASRSPAHSPALPAEQNQELEQDPDVEGETLGERKRRLENSLPPARPVSSAFSAELLSQFGDLDKAAGEEAKEAKGAAVNEEEETLGQRRRRLQAEKEAREREMGHYSNHAGQPQQDGQSPPQQPQQQDQRAPAKRLSMASMLSAYPRRMQMAAPPPVNHATDRSGGFKGGLYNDGQGGAAARSSISLGQPMAYGQGYGQQMYGGGGPVHVNSPYGQMPYGGVQSRRSVAGLDGYYAAAAQWGATPQMAVPMQQSRSVNRVEQWRHGVMP